MIGMRIYVACCSKEKVQGRGKLARGVSPYSSPPRMMSGGGVSGRHLAGTVVSGGDGNCAGTMGARAQLTLTTDTEGQDTGYCTPAPQSSR